MHRLQRLGGVQPVHVRGQDTPHLRGLVITALSTPDIAAHVTLASPFGAAGKDRWSLAAIGIASLAMAFLEPDPTTEWDEQRLAEIHRALDTREADGR